ncbi:MAG: Maf-like protein [Gammaproteobacteria bacterium]|nr:Maf-like protein [Gammaproteobacteria bacterium]
MKLVLASTSPYRRDLLSRLKIPFGVCSPEVDETPHQGETPEQTAYRLAIAKAQSSSVDYPDALIIGSDQVATLDGLQLGKPHTHDNAVKQLTMMRGRSVVFHTALCLYNSRTGSTQAKVVPFTVQFRNLSDAQIERYLVKEQPYNCAGSAKSEGLGIALIEKMSGDDPNALIGLPLIALVEMLENEGMPVI